MNDIAPTIKKDLQIINDLSYSTINSVNHLIEAIQKGYENAPELVDSIYNKVNTLSDIATTLEQFLTKLDEITPGISLGDAIDSIKSINNKLNSAKEALSIIKEQLNNGQTPSLDKLNNVLTLLNDVNNITSLSKVKTL